MKEVYPNLDQFNSIHEHLIEAWKLAATDPRSGGEMVFACLSGHLEDYMTTQYLRDTAMQAGLKTSTSRWSASAGTPTGGSSSMNPRKPFARASSFTRGNGCCANRSAEPGARYDVVARIPMEDALKQQGDPAGAVGALSREPVSLARVT
jgi:hypothetical protein